VINKYREFSGLNESIRKPKFKVGDNVIILPELSYYIQKYGWSEKMHEMIGKNYKIRKIDFNNFREIYEYSLNNSNHNYVYADCIKLVNEEKKEEPPVKVRWYKKGKLESDK
jgi:hypothetical protein